MEPSQADVLPAIPEYKERGRTAAKKLSKTASSDCWDSTAGGFFCNCYNWLLKREEESWAQLIVDNYAGELNTITMLSM